MTAVPERLAALAELGGPVVLLLIALSVAVLALALAKLWQFRRAGVGRHRALEAALAAWDRGERAGARGAAAQAGHLAELLAAAFAAEGPPEAVRARLTGLAEARLADLARGLRLLDSAAQLAPLLGLFGTVLGMIAAFRTLEAAGAAVDPAALAGGIWVALLTTAAGLAVAMPAALLLSWFDARIAAEARAAQRVIDVALCPGMAAPAPASALAAGPGAAEGWAHA